MDTEETKTEQEQTESLTFAQRIESITNDWKESILQEVDSLIEPILTEEDVESIAETVIENSSDLDNKIGDYIDDYDMDSKIETWIDYNLDVEDKVDDALRYYDWDNVMDEIDIGRFLRRINDDLAQQVKDAVEDAVEQARSEDNPIHRVEEIEGRIETILDMLQNLSISLFHQVNDIQSKGDA